MSDEQGETDADAGAADGPTGDDGHDAGRADAGGTRADAAPDAASTDSPEATGNGAATDDPTPGDATSEDAGDGDAAGTDAGTADGADDDAAGEAAPPPVEAIADRVADADADSIAAEIVELRETVRSLESDLADALTDRDDLEDRLKRKAAEFQNYKKRQEKRRAEVRDRATEDLVEELLEVRDNLNRALEQDENADIREGVEATSRQLDEVLGSENVEAIEPDPGSDVDPARHEVLLNVGSEQPDGTVAGVHRTGYEMAGKVLRPAQVTVSEGEPD